MKAGLADLEAMTEAWPKGICLWCGGNRHQNHALCRTCWFTVEQFDRMAYLSMSLPDRARWLIAHKPTVPA